MRLGNRDRGPEPGRPVVALREHQTVGPKSLRQFGVRLEPGRAFPAAALVEDGTEFALARIERAGPQPPQGGAELVGVDDVVDLDEGLRAGLLDELRAAGHILEAVQIALVDIDRRCPVDDPLGRCLGDARGMRHPDRFGNPEAAQVAMLTHDREAVGGEREDAVERLLDLRITQCGNQFAGFMPPGCEVFLRERQHRRHRLPRGVGHQGRHVDRHRIVRVGANADAVDVLAEVQILILMTQDRQPRLRQLGVASDQRADLAAPRVLVRHRHQRDDETDLPGELGTPEPRRTDHDVGVDHAVIGCTPMTRPRFSTMPTTSVWGRKVAPRARARQPGPRRRAPPSPGRRRVCETRRASVAVQQRMQVHAFGLASPDDPRYPTPAPSPPCGAGQPNAAGWWPPRVHRPR